MRFRASNTYDFYRPSRCERRVALRYRGVPEAERSEFEKLLLRLGERHEKAHFVTLSEVVDLSAGDDEARERETLAAVRAGAPAIYQGRFRAPVEIDGETCDLVGEPDFLIRDGVGYRIRDSKLARRIDDDPSSRDRLAAPAIRLALRAGRWERGRPAVAISIAVGEGTFVS